MQNKILDFDFLIIAYHLIFKVKFCLLLFEKLEIFIDYLLPDAFDNKMLYLLMFKRPQNK